MLEKVKKICTIFMVFTILVSTHAFAYYEHTCLITKHKSYSLEPKTCAGKGFPEESKTAEIKRSSCCELNLKIQKVDDGLKNILCFSVNSPLAILNTVFVFENPEFQIHKEASLSLFFTNNSPPSQKVYIQNQQFLI
jgi:hypothetical protein